MDAIHVEGHLRLAVLAILTAERASDYKANVGVPMGHTFGPDLFMEGDSEGLKLWNQDLPRANSLYQTGYCRDPNTETMADLSLRAYVDDEAKQHVVSVVSSIDNVVDTVRGCNRGAEHELGSCGYNQNKKKELLIVGLRG